MTEAAALLYAGLCAGVVLFQLALILGAPWGRLTQGGRHRGALPASGRVLAAVSAVLLLGMAGGLLSAAGFWPRWPVWTGWGALAMSCLSFVLNGVTPSREERRLWVPVTGLMAALAVYVMAA